MAVKRQVSKKKLLEWIEKNKYDATIHVEELREAINSGELDMTKDWRLNKDEM